MLDFLLPIVIGAILIACMSLLLTVRVRKTPKRSAHNFKRAKEMGLDLTVMQQSNKVLQTELEEFELGV